MSAGSFEDAQVWAVVGSASVKVADGAAVTAATDAWGTHVWATLTPAEAIEIGEALIRLAKEAAPAPSEEVAPAPFEETLSDYGWVRVDMAHGVVRVDAHDGEERTITALLPAQAARIAEALAQAAKGASA